MGIQQAAAPATSGRPGIVYVLVPLQIVVGLLMIFGFQGLGIGPASDGFNVGFPLGIVDLVFVTGLWMGRRWGRWGRWGVGILAAVGAVASVLGSVQAYLNNTVTTTTTVGPDLPMIPLAVELVILYFITRPANKTYFVH
jgi:hypothetical protein